jgi:hypothetical protein
MPVPLLMLYEPINGESRMHEHPALKLTDAERTAGVIPADFAYQPVPTVDVRRYGYNIDASEAVNTNALEDAKRGLQKTGGFPGGIIQLPPGEAGIDDFLIPWYVLIRGLGRSTQLNYSGSGTAFTLGSDANTGALQYGCGIENLALVLSHKDATGVYLRETRAAKVSDLYIEGPATSGRTNRGVVIDGGDGSSHDNAITNVICNHLENGYVILTTGGQRATNTKFDNCSAFGDVDGVGTASKGLSIISNGRADGATWFGGGIEKCGTGMYFDATALSMSVYGTRFESNTVDGELVAGCKPIFFFGLQSDSAYKFTDPNGVAGFYGCATVSGSRWSAQGTFVATLTTMSSTTTGNVTWRRMDKIVELYVPSSILGTLNGTSLTLTGLPQGLTPSVNKSIACGFIENGGQNNGGLALVKSDNTIAFYINAVASGFVRPSASGFTTATSSGLQAGWAIRYGLD